MADLLKKSSFNAIACQYAERCQAICEGVTCPDPDGYGCRFYVSLEGHSAAIVYFELGILTGGLFTPEGSIGLMTAPTVDSETAQSFFRKMVELAEVVAQFNRDYGSQTFEA